MATTAQAAGHGHAHHHGHDHKHGHESVGMQACAHNEVEIERYIILYLVAGIMVLIPLFNKFLHLVDDEVAQIPALIGAIGLTIPLVMAAWKEIKRRRPSSSTLAAVAILAALSNGDYVPAGLLALILLLADQILSRTAWGAQRAIEQLVGLTPDTARIVEAGSEREVGLETVGVGQTVRVRPGENLPVDGRVASGRSTINQASLTGEAVPAEVQPGDPVYAGTTNLTGQIDITVTQVGAETTIGKVTKLIREAESARSPRQLIIEQVSSFFVPIALMVAAVAWFVKIQSPNPAVKAEAVQAFVTVLIVTCPAALLLASPSAMVAAFAAAARLGVMIKRTDYLEAAARADAVVFDKTGTMTTGKFGVSRLAPATGVDGAELLRAAAEAEQHSNHPLAQSILATAKAARIEPSESERYEEIHGRGVKAKTAQGELCVGRASWLLELNPGIADELKVVETAIEGMTGVHVMRDGRYLGAVGLEDRVRPETRGVIQHLRDLGVRQIAMFTGDRLSVAKRVGQAVGVDSIEAECLPEEKHQQVKQLTASGLRVMMVGDGINDGPSLAAADVGVAMGLGGSDIAANSAGVALMNDELSRVPFLIELSRKTRSIIAQNIAASIIIVLIGLVLAATGLLAVPMAALYHFVGEVFVLGNSFRLFRYGEDFAEAEKRALERGQAPQRRAASVRGLAAAQPG